MYDLKKANTLTNGCLPKPLISLIFLSQTISAKTMKLLSYTLVVVNLNLLVARIEPLLKLYNNQHTNWKLNQSIISIEIKLQNSVKTS